MEDVYSWFSTHPHLAGLTVFVIALAESLAVVGLLIPGVAMMFAAGALIGAGALEFVPVCAWAVAGAIAGDGLSFWLGRQFRDHLRSVWPFRAHPEMIARGTRFFHRYGGRSILFGRFVGPVRAVIPLVAGMLTMPTHRFLAVNVISALLWGPVYLLPGMAFGASLEVASKITGRLVTVLVLLLASLWLTAWTSKQLYAFLRPRAHRFILLSFDLSRRHPLLARLTVPLIDPHQRDYAGLAIWGLLLLATSLLISRAPNVELFSLSSGALRTPWSDYLFTVLESLGRYRTLGTLAVLVIPWLWVKQQNVALAHWLAAMGLVTVMEAMWQWRPGSDPPLDDLTFRAGVFYGFLAVLLADDLRLLKWHWLVYTTMTLTVVLIGFSRLYLAAGTLSSIALAWLMALAWLLVVGVAFRRHRSAGHPAGSLVWLTGATLAAVLAAQAQSHSLSDFESHPTVTASFTREEWMESGWRTLPDRQVRIFGRPDQDLAVQWAASLSELHDTLRTAGWREPVPFTWPTAMSWLNPSAPISELPVLPHFNQSGIDQLRVLKQLGQGDWLILRFWPSGHQLQDTGEPVWLGAYARLQPRTLLRLARFSEEIPVDRETLRGILDDLGKLSGSYRLTQRNHQGRIVWLVARS